VLRTRRLQHPSAARAGVHLAEIVAAVLLTLVGTALLPVSAGAQPTDATLTVIVNRDIDQNGSYSSDIDQPQPGIEISVTDASGHSVHGVTGRDGRFVHRASTKLAGGRYFVVAKVPHSLAGLTPVPESSTFQPWSTTVDLTSETQTVRMGVAVGRTPAEPLQPQPTSVSRGSDRPQFARFAVGDLVWMDDNRSGVQDPGELPASLISVQLLNVDGEVVASTVSQPSGRYVFDNLAAGTYSVRFAGVPKGKRLTTAGRGQRVSDSDPDFSGVTPPFTLGVGEPNVRPTTTTDQVSAAYIDPTIDAGITPLRYGVGDHVWLDLNSDGIQQPDEPAGSATVSLLTDAGDVVATTTTDAAGSYHFFNLASGSYRLQFAGLPADRAFTLRASGTDPALDSDPDPRTGRTNLFTLAQGAPDLVPAIDADASSTDFENRTLNAGLVSDTTINARLTTTASNHVASASNSAAVDAALASTAGVAPQLPSSAQRLRWPEQVFW